MLVVKSFSIFEQACFRNEQYDAQRTKRAFMQFVDNGGPNQPAHRRRSILPSFSAYRISKHFTLRKQAYSNILKILQPKKTNFR